MPRRLLSTLAVIFFVASAANAQSGETPESKRKPRAASVDQAPPAPPAPNAPATPSRPPTPPAAPAPPPPPRKGQPINIKVEVMITDQRASAAPVKKTVSVIVGDQQSGMIRSESLIPNIGSVPLHIDAEPEILADGKIRLRLGLNYDLPIESNPGAAPERIAKTSIRETLALILESGKPLLATQSADPVGDRQVMVEVKATVLK